MKFSYPSLKELERLRALARKEVKGMDTVELSGKIAMQYEHYADRWNPGRWAYVQEMEKILKMKLMEEMGYTISEWMR